jgi:hypothetical protein
VSENESIFLRALSDRINSIRAQNEFEEEPDISEIPDELISEIQDELIYESDIVPNDMRHEIEAELSDIKKSRMADAAAVRQAIANEWGDALDALDHVLACAELINRRMTRALRHGGAVLIKKRPRPDPETATGAPLMCLFGLSIHARACVIATEVSILIRDGLFDGVESRLRTIYEHAVIMTLILRDRTYEAAERYQDHACFEELHRLRILQSSFADPIFSNHAAARESIAEEIAEGEGFADRARARWGKEIREQYEWARPALPPEMRNRKRITFSDLEAAAGAQLMRGDYIGYNYYVHAGPYMVINHVNFNAAHIFPMRAVVDQERVSFVGTRCVRMIRWMSEMLAITVARESGDYDAILYFCEMTNFFRDALGKFERNEGKL